MKRRLITASLLALLVPGAVAAAQSDPGRVTGVVTSLEGNLPLTGVRVLVVGSPASVTTNTQGRYTFTLAPAIGCVPRRLPALAGLSFRHPGHDGQKAKPASGSKPARIGGVASNSGREPTVSPERR